MDTWTCVGGVQLKTVQQKFARMKVIRFLKNKYEYTAAQSWWIFQPSVGEASGVSAACRRKAIENVSTRPWKQLFQLKPHEIVVIRRLLPFPMRIGSGKISVEKRREIMPRNPTSMVRGYRNVKTEICRGGRREGRFRREKWTHPIGRPPRPRVRAYAIKKSKKHSASPATVVVVVLTGQRRCPGVRRYCARAKETKKRLRNPTRPDDRFYTTAARVYHTHALWKSSREKCEPITIYIRNIYTAVFP